MLTGENGLLTKVGQAKEKNEIAKIKEKINLAYMGAKVGELGKVSDSNFKNELKNEFGENGYNFTISEDGQKWIVEVEGTVVEFDAGILKENNAFFVYHSSDNTIEKIRMDDNRVSYNSETDKYTFNIVNETKENYIYGGYANAYNGSGLSNEEIINGEYTLQNANNNRTYVQNISRGEYLLKDNNGTNYEGGNVVWNEGDFNRENGTKMNPEKGRVYYLKEVPDKYLSQYIYYVYNTTTKKVDQLYLLSAVDDGIYSNVLMESDKNIGDRYKFCKSFALTKPDKSIVSILTSTDNYVNSNHPNEPTTNVFSSVGVKFGYLMIYKIPEGNELIAPNQVFTCRSCCITADNVKVYGKNTDQISLGDGTKDGIEITTIRTSYEYEAE